MARETFADTDVIWSFHLIRLSIGTSKYLTYVFISIGSQDILKSVLSGSPLLLTCNVFFLNLGYLISQITNSFQYEKQKLTK